MSDIVLDIENVSKLYRLGQVGTKSMKDDFVRFFYRLSGKEDPFLQMGIENDRTKSSASDYVWALKDINFQVRRGDVVGIIGRNGAGKSTLLKLLSKVTKPTSGSIKIKGRIASLLEVGTGFHQELTGRENIYLNGAILGMTKREIKSKLDEIVDFAGVEKYLDTPVKRYSSGMTVRLGFAIAAHLEPAILIVDEVLAVGDVEFQKRALGKMQDVSKGEGRTIIFVSHNMLAVSALCTRGILIEKGKISLSGTVEDVVGSYLNINSDLTKKGVVSPKHERPWGQESITIEKINVLSSEGREGEVFSYGDMLSFSIFFENKNEIPDLSILIIIKNSFGVRLSYMSSLEDLSKLIQIGKGQFKLETDLNVLLTPGVYFVDLRFMGLESKKAYDALDEVISFKIDPNITSNKKYPFEGSISPIRTKTGWKIV